MKEIIDNEIINALENEIHLVNYVNGFSADNVSLDLLQNTLNLINRLKSKKEALRMDKEQLESDVINANMNCEHLLAEIERLQKSIELMKGAKCVYSYDGETLEYCTSSPCPISKTLDQIKSESIKDFAERLKNKSELLAPSVYAELFRAVSVEDIDTLVKEMTESEDI